MKPNVYKCDICGSTAINHTQFDCNWNKQAMRRSDFIKTEPVESKQIKKSR